MPVINGVYLKDFTALPGAVADANIIPIAISGDNVAYRTTVAGIVTDARITAKLLTGLSVTGGAVVAADTILAAFGKVQNQINGKQGTITLTTTGTSGAATLVSNTLNIPNYADAFVGTVTSVGLSSATSGVTIGSTPVTTSGTITIAIATATSLLNGLLSSTDWTTFNNKQGTITLTTTGTSGAATFSANTLNIPQYADSFVGTVTSVAALTLGTTGSDLSSTVANGTTTPVITLQVPTASAANRGALSSADWSTFNSKAAALSGTINTIAYWDSSTTIASLALATYPSLTELSYVKGVTSAIQTQLNAKQATITLTTTGTSGAATFSANTLNIPQYQAAGTYVTSVTGTSPIVSSGGTTPAISIPVATTSVNGYLSSADWTTFNGKQATITLTTTGTSGAATFSSNTLNIPNYADSFVGTVTSVAAITLGTTGTDLSSTVANGTTTPVITLQVPTASAANRGALSSADWSTFNGKQGTITLTTTGTSGAATFSANTLNIPNYGSALSGYLPLSGGTLTGQTLVSYAMGADNGFIIQHSNLTQGISIGYNTIKTSGTSANQNLTFYSQGTGVINLVSNTQVNGTFAALSTGSFTGALSGTSATFSGKITSTVGNNLQFLENTSATTGYISIHIRNTSGITYVGNEGSLTGQILTGSLAYSTIVTSGGATALQLGTDQTARLTILPTTGNVGIGTTSPQYPLQVKSGTNINFAISTGVADATAVRLNAVNDAVTANIPMEFYATKFNFNLGNVGIGTTSPTNPLHIVSNTLSQLNIQALSGNTNAQINLEPTGTGIALIGPANNVDLAFRTNATTRLTIASTGAATFSSSVTAAGATFSDTTAVASAAGTSQMRIDRSGTVARIQNYDTGQAANISLAHDGGNVGIGTTTPSEKLEVNGAIKTAAPSGGTAKPFKVGAVSATGPAIENKVMVEIDSVVYYIPLSAAVV